MPPILGGFFMVRSYYLSECYADYFVFERIEALKPAIEACGISTLSQSPVLGFHKLMDNRIKLLEENEACVYGTLDFVAYPRFPAPVEFIAAVIAYYVHPVNIQTACLIMEGAEFTENIINGVERPVKAAELFAFTLRVRAGNTDVLTDAEENVRQKLRAEGVM